MRAKMHDQSSPTDPGAPMIPAVNVHERRVLPTARQHLDQPIQVFLAVEERLHQHAFVLPVYAHIVHITSQPGMAISRYPGITQIATVGRTGAHGGNDRSAWPELGRELSDYTHDLRM